MRRRISMTSLAIALGCIALSCESSTSTSAAVDTIGADAASDGTSGADATDVTDGSDAVDGADVTDGSDAVDGADVTDGSDASDGADVTDGSDAVDGGGLSFQHVYETVFVAKGCSAGYCHGAGSGGMQFGTHEEAYAELVNKPATQTDCGLATRVVPGAPDDSVLWVRVRPEAGPACSAQKMPSGTSGLDEASAQLVYDWIQDGAKP